MPVDVKEARRIAVISGKGGVGKTVISANLAAALAHNGLRVLVLDADLGLAGLDIMLGLTPEYTIQEFLSGIRTPEEIVLHTNKGFDLLPAGSGFAGGSVLSIDLAVKLESLLDELKGRYDVILFDAGAGIGEVVLFFANLADEILVVVTPEPTSLTNCYATIKLLNQMQGRSEFLLLVNQTNPNCPGQIGALIADHLQKVISRFIESGESGPVNIRLVGSIPSDPAIPQSVQRQQLLTHMNPEAPSACIVTSLADFFNKRTAC